MKSPIFTFRLFILAHGLMNVMYAERHSLKINVLPSIIECIQVSNPDYKSFGNSVVTSTVFYTYHILISHSSFAGERPYLCSLCGKTFTESCKLKRHLTRVHKAETGGSKLVSTLFFFKIHTFDL